MRDSGRSARSDEIAELKASVAELTALVNQLAAKPAANGAGTAASTTSAKK